METVLRVGIRAHVDTRTHIKEGTQDDSISAQCLDADYLGQKRIIISNFIFRSVHLTQGNLT